MGTVDLMAKIPDSSSIAEDDVKKLKNLGEVIERLRTRRKDVKTQLSKDLDDEKEGQWATELSETSKAILSLENDRRALVRSLAARATTPVNPPKR
jgi:ABC-type phosphate transport system auxiliary subunit